MSHQCNRLNSFAETHLVGKDTVDTLLVEVVKPPETFELIVLQLGTKHFGLFNLLLLFLVFKLVHVEIILTDFVLNLTMHVYIALSIPIKVAESSLVFVDHPSHAFSGSFVVEHVLLLFLKVCKFSITVRKAPGARAERRPAVCLKKRIMFCIFVCYLEIKLH